MSSQTTTVPRTPTPEPISSVEDTPPASPSGKDALARATAAGGGAMTPPPSSQAEVGRNNKDAARSAPPPIRLASPPPTLQAAPSIAASTATSKPPHIASPSAESVEKMGEGELRRLVTELLPALSEARVAAAHARLQHSLLTIETEEYVKRAEVEHDATRREVQLLQESSPIHHSNNYSSSSSAASRHSSSRGTAPSASSSMQQNLHLALTHCRDLQQENAVLDRRLRASKRLIANLDSRNHDLRDHVSMLRQRIRDNREHITDLQESGAISLAASPASNINGGAAGNGQFYPWTSSSAKGTPHTPINRRTLPNLANHSTGSQNAFDALLQASHVLNGEINNSHASSTDAQQRRNRSKGGHASHHVRGAHSLSSLSAVQQRRPVTADASFPSPSPRASMGGGASASGATLEPAAGLTYSAPETQLTYDNNNNNNDNDKDIAYNDRESTISASDDEAQNVRQSDGSSSSSTTPRSNGGPSQAGLHSPDATGRAMNESRRGLKMQVQSKLTGQVRKPAAASAPSSSLSSQGRKRRFEEEEAEERGSKAVRVAQD